MCTSLYYGAHWAPVSNPLLFLECHSVVKFSETITTSTKKSTSVIPFKKYSRPEVLMSVPFSVRMTLSKSDHFFINLVFCAFCHSQLYSFRCFRLTSRDLAYCTRCQSSHSFSVAHLRLLLLHLSILSSETKLRLHHSSYT